MKIKEVERRVGISSKNIRYYEEMGLILPVRNAANNYREYSEADVEKLERIKFLRMLGISLADIRAVNSGSLPLEDVLEKQILELKEQDSHLKEMIEVCERLKRHGYSIDELNETTFESCIHETEESIAESGRNVGSDVFWRQRLEQIIETDLVEEKIPPEKVNRIVAMIAISGYVICAIVSMLAGQIFLGRQNTRLYDFGGMLFGGFLVFIVLGIGSYIGQFMTANIKVLLGMYFLTVLPLSLATAYVISYITDDFPVGALAVYWIMLAVYLSILYILFGTKRRYPSGLGRLLLMAAVYMACMTLVTRLVWGITGMTVGFMGIFTLYLSLNWYHLNQMNENRNLYYAVCTGTNLLNVIGRAFDLRGYATSRFYYVRKDD